MITDEKIDKEAKLQLVRVRQQLLLEKTTELVFAFPDFRLEVIQKAIYAGHMLQIEEQILRENFYDDVGRSDIQIGHGVELGAKHGLGATPNESKILRDADGLRDDLTPQEKAMALLEDRIMDLELAVFQK